MRRSPATRPSVGGRFALFVGLALLASLAVVPSSRAQDRLEFGGLAYLDYYYLLSAPDEAREGLNGFQYRRLYLTTDYQISDAFDVRARLEAPGELVEPFVKDLYLRYTMESGHRLGFGIMPPPAFELEEDVWGFRSLEKTLLDLFDVVSSRDFGLRADGPLLADGKLRYAVMAGNNNSIVNEQDPYKRVYALLEAFPTDHLVFSLGGDYADLQDPVSGALRFTGFGGYLSETFHGGAQVTWYRVGAEPADDRETLGVSVFGTYWLNDRWGLVGRVDHLSHGDAVPEAEDFFFGGLVYEPHERVQISPNVHVLRDSERGSEVAARMTVHFTFGE